MDVELESNSQRRAVAVFTVPHPAATASYTNGSQPRRTSVRCAIAHSSPNEAITSIVRRNVNGKANGKMAGGRGPANVSPNAERLGGIDPFADVTRDVYVAEQILSPGPTERANPGGLRIALRHVPTRQSQRESASFIRL